MPSFDAGQTGITPGVTILTAAGAVHTARATAGITEPVAGSGVYHFAHPDPGTLLLFVFDIGDGEVGTSVWDDGLTPQAAAQAAIVAEGVSTFNAAVDPVEVGNIADIADAVDGRVTGDTLINQDTVVDGTALGLTTPGATLTLYAAADTARSTPLRRTTAAVDGTWSLPAPSGSLVLVVSKDGFYDAADGDATIEVAITVE